MPRKGVPQLLDEFWRAQARIGTEAKAQALASWTTVNPAALDVTGMGWLRTVLTTLRASRSLSRRNAMAFYRLYRALETGCTVALPDQVAENLPLGQLRQEWAREANLPFTTGTDDAREIPVEPFQWPETADDRMERAAAINLAGTGIARAQDITSAATEGRGRLDDPDFLASLESAGRNAANAADQEAIRAGRDLVDQASKRDRRVIGWARVTDGNPCHFCAMLASRGAIYTSKLSASTVRDAGILPDNPEALKKYHPGCHCQVVPVYSRNDFLTPEARRLSKEWQTVTRGKTGADARKVWRQHVEARQRTRATAENERLLQLAQEA